MKFYLNPFFLTDGYKTGHHLMYPEDTAVVYSNFTPRSNKYAPKGCDKVVSFGQQLVMKYINQAFVDGFFNRDKDEVCQEIKREYSMYLNTDYDVSHIEALHDLGYLPIQVQALPEGTEVPMRVPVLTIWNTHKDFAWITNFLETIISNMLWKPMTSATIARQYKKNLTEWAMKTDPDNVEFVNFQGHDFSMRGMDSPMATMTSGLGHATSFLGSDSLPVIHAAREYYHEDEFVVGSVNATEHSVMCAGTKGDEVGTFRRLMNTFPTGILSVVSGTWDLWKVLTEYLPELKEEVLARDGKLVIRPDSGDPVDIICGRNSNPKDVGTVGFPYEKCSEEYRNHVSPSEYKGVIELLWDLFGGTINDQGYKVLDPSIGAIYGDSITIERAEQICKRLADKGFASTNIVLGVGSFTYQYNTRDTFGFAMKATYIELKQRCEEADDCLMYPEPCEPCQHPTTRGIEIFKDPITDDGTKKSAKGLLAVVKNKDGEYELVDQTMWAIARNCELKTIYQNGVFNNETTLTEIRQRLNS